MHGIDFYHHHTAHVNAAEIEWDACVDEPIPFQRDHMQLELQWWLDDVWVIHIFLGVFLPVRIVDKGVSGHGKTWSYEHQRLKWEIVFATVKINVCWSIE